MNIKGSSILIVDDEKSVRELLALELSEYKCSLAESAEGAIKLMATNSFDLVLSDITMPGSSGLELCAFIQKTYPDTVVVMVSAMNDIHYAIEAMRHGAFDYVVKPFQLMQVSFSVERALQHQALLVFKQHHERLLEETVRIRTDELRAVNEDLHQMLDLLYANYRATLRGLARALEARDVETGGHSDRVVAYCLRIGQELGLTQKELIALEQGALLHDIGKIGVRDSILLKPGPLTEGEWVEMRQHVTQGLSIIRGIDFLSGAGAVVGQHHEKFDGSGYPNGLSGESVHIHARIFAVADAYDALTSDRVYRSACSHADACIEIRKHLGTHFDPRVVEAFLRIPEPQLKDLRLSATSSDYTNQIIEEREILSFILSLKQPSKTMRLPAS